MEKEQIMNENSNEDEISLIDLFAVLLKHKFLIIGITGLFMFFAVVFSIITIVLPPEKSPLPNEYTPSAHMLINDTSSGGSSISSLISSSGFGSLASLAGISGGGNSYSSLALYLAGSNTLLDIVVDNFDLINKWEIEKSPRANSRRALKEKLTASFDDKSGVLSISFTDYNADFACQVVNFTVDYLESRFTDLGLDKNILEKRNLEDNIETSYNEILRLQKEISNIENRVSNIYSAATAPSIALDANMLKLELNAQQQVYTQLKTQYEVLKITMASETPIFQILERAEIPDMKSKPSRGKLCIIISFAGAFISVFIAFFLNALENIKKDPVAMSKLRGKNND